MIWPAFRMLTSYVSALKPGWRIEHDIDQNWLSLLAPTKSAVLDYECKARFKLRPGEDDGLIEVIDNFVLNDELKADDEGLYHLPGQATPVADVIAFAPRKPGGPTP